MSRYQGPRSKHIGGGGYRNNPAPSTSGYRRRSRSPESSAARRKAELDRELDERYASSGPSRDFQPRSVGKKERQSQRDTKPYARPEDRAGGGDAGPSAPPGQETSPVKPISEMSFSSEEGMITPPQKHAHTHPPSLDVVASSVIVVDPCAPVAVSAPPAILSPISGQRSISPDNKSKSIQAERESRSPTRTIRESSAAQTLEDAQHPPIGGFSTIQFRNRLSPTKRSSVSASASAEGLATAPVSNLLDPRDDEDDAMVGGGRRRGGGSVSRGRGSRSPQKRPFKADDGRSDRRYEDRERDRTSASYRDRERERDRDQAYPRDRRHTTGGRDNMPHPNHGRGFDRGGAQHPSSDSRSGSRSSRSRSRTPPPRQPPSGPRIRDEGPSSTSRYPPPRRDEPVSRKSGTDEPAPYIPSGPSGGTWASKRGGYGTPIRGRGGYDRVGPGAVSGGREEFAARGGPIPSGPKFRIPPAEIRSRADVDAEREREKERMEAANAIELQQQDAPENSPPARAPAGSWSERSRRASNATPASGIDIDMDGGSAHHDRQAESRRDPAIIASGPRLSTAYPSVGPPPPPSSTAPPPPPPPPTGPASWAARRAAPASTGPTPGPASSVPSNVTPSPRTPMTPATHASRSPDMNAGALPASFSSVSLAASASGRSIGGGSYQSRVAQHQASASPGTPSTPREHGGDREGRTGNSFNGMPPPAGPRMDSRKPPDSSPINPYSMPPSTPIVRPRGESTSSAVATPAPGVQATPSRPSDQGTPSSVIKPPQPQLQQHRSRGISGWKVKPPPVEVQSVEPKVEIARFEDSKGKVVEFTGRAPAKVGRDNWQEWQIELRALQHQRSLLTHSFQPLAASFRDIKMKLMNNEDYVLATAMKIDAATEIEYDKNLGYLSD